MNRRDLKLDSLIGKKVRVVLFDDSSYEGILGFSEEFSEKYGYKKPNYYYIDGTTDDNNICFRKTHVKQTKAI
ncbi:hypothetical protein bpr_II345 (plasmid) [Butyrivibrio proteoclasticus B316]|uniref:Uncharacterized protein n=1 Tax=Butyrivibrio proteoclasticus (strain ATCC 51982 / DSM 14932 / B316) TaxID=515622 RepID=E0S4F0_BUTPB|nr:hypothetical protein [Butyrivibrio proteoclasticus]ADL36282.1 hypothetical protein bpr_II345 [Butyrivibrio proteoclasticus B316]